MAQTKFNARLGLSVGSTPTDVLDGDGNFLITVPVTAGGTGVTGPGTLGNVLTSTGTGWVSQAPQNITGPTGPTGAASTVAGPTGPAGASGNTVAYTKSESDALYATITTVNAIPNPVAMALVFGS